MDRNGGLGPVHEALWQFCKRQALRKGDEPNPTGVKSWHDGLLVCECGGEMINRV